MASDTPTYIVGAPLINTVHIMFYHPICNTGLRGAVMWGTQVLSSGIEKDISGS